MKMTDNEIMMVKESKVGKLGLFKLIKAKLVYSTKRDMVEMTTMKKLEKMLDSYGPIMDQMMKVTSMSLNEMMEDK